jgi:hypothetical protein
MEELKLGIAAGNRFTVILADLPKTPVEIRDVKRQKGIVKVNLGHGHRTVNDRWQPLRDGDIVRGTGEFGPVYTCKQLGGTA